MTMERETTHGGCPQCGDPKLVYDPSSGEKVCSRCGLVIADDAIDRGPEWRAITLEEKAKKTRTGIPTSYIYYDKGLYTSFRTNRDSRGRRLDSKIRMKMRRLKRYDNRSKLDESGMRNLSRAMTELNRLAETLHLPHSVREKAAVLYRRALRNDLIKGRSIVGFITASLYAACRLMKIPRTLREVSDASTQDLRDVARTYRFILRELNLKMPIDYPMKFVPKIASKIEVSRETDRMAVKILREARKRRTLIGKDPRGMAAAALYLACKANDEYMTQKDIAEAAGTTEVTLRNRLRDLEKMAEQTSSGGSYEHDIRLDLTE